MEILNVMCHECGANVDILGDETACQYCSANLKSQIAKAERLAEAEASNKTTRKCSFCAENINKNTIKCKHCGEFLKYINDMHKEVCEMAEEELSNHSNTY